MGIFYRTLKLNTPILSFWGWCSFKKKKTDYQRVKDVVYHFNIPRHMALSDPLSFRDHVCGVCSSGRSDVIPNSGLLVVDTAGKQEPWGTPEDNTSPPQWLKKWKNMINYSPGSMHYWLGKLEHLLGHCCLNENKNNLQTLHVYFLEHDFSLQRKVNCLIECLSVWSPSIATHLV